ncbi:MAG: metallophosphoesterase [Bacteroidia bacterium]|nr:metallophosphoesterase [Bacteroidia bacterium]
MKTYQLIVFLLIVFAVYFIGNAYIFFKGYNIIPPVREKRVLYTIIFIAIAVTFIAAKILESRHSSVLTDILNIIGGFWMAFMLYGFIFLILSDITALILRIPGIINSGNIMNYRKWAFFITAGISVVLILGGFINAVIPVVSRYDITINKAADDVKELKIAAVSDIHLGSIIRKRSLKKLSGMFEREQPDIVFLLGDIVDGELGPVLRGDLLQYFTMPHTVDGLFAITGNHEFIGGADRTIPYIESKGITVLKDEIIKLPGGIQLIGRLDRDSRRFYGKDRLPLSDLMKDIDHSRPVIVLDHQPFNLEEAEKNGVDLQLSGHTHNGQFWPLNYITRKMYELSYGYQRKGNTQIIVSSGFGLWGPRVRSGSRSEMIVINVNFTAD